MAPTDRKEGADTVIQQALNRGPVRTEDVRRAFHGTGLFGRFNERVATSITAAVGTMWMAYAFALLALISFPAAIASQNPLIIVAWIAQTFLQLVLLPVIIVGQNVQAAHADARAESDHEIISQLFIINQRQLEILELLHGGKYPKVGGPEETT